MVLALLKLSTILTTVLAPVLGIFILLRNPRSPVNRLWFATSLAVTVWSVGYLLAMTTFDAGAAYRYLLMVYTGATMIPILYFHFVSRFLLRIGSRFRADRRYTAYTNPFSHLCHVGWRRGRHHQFCHRPRWRFPVWAGDSALVSSFDHVRDFYPKLKVYI